MIEEREWQETAKAMLPAMYRVAYGLLGSDADAQDAVQTALMKAWETRDRASSEHMKGYVTRIVVNESRNIQRARMRMSPVSEVPERRAVQEESRLSEVLEAIYALPQPLREAVVLKYLNDTPEKEAARALGIPMTTLRSRLFRARQQLRKTLCEEVTLG